MSRLRSNLNGQVRNHQRAALPCDSPRVCSVCRWLLCDWEATTNLPTPTPASLHHLSSPPTKKPRSNGRRCPAPAACQPACRSNHYPSGWGHAGYARGGYLDAASRFPRGGVSSLHRLGHSRRWPCVRSPLASCWGHTYGLPRTNTWRADASAREVLLVARDG